MSLPPQQIRVKRKRAEEAPVTYLQFESSSKRHRSGSTTAWVYKRKDPGAPGNHPSLDPTLNSEPPRPIIHASKPGDELRVPRPQPSENHAPTNARTVNHDVPAIVGVSDASDGRDQTPLSERRRYHISKAALASALRTGRGSPTVAGGISKQDRHGPIFVERKRLSQPHSLAKPLRKSRKEGVSRVSDQDLPRSQTDVDMMGNNDTDPRERSRDQERGTEPDRPNHRPLPFVDPITENMDKMAASMNAWVLEEIGANLGGYGAAPKTLRKPSSRFRPKAPAQRFAERHPEMERGNLQGTTAQTPTDRTGTSDEDDDLDSECVYDTYERVPADRLTGTHDPGDVGFLILDNEDEAEYFYWQDNDSDEDEVDEEDENAETHYTADYPEDEVDSDDEHNIGAYKYRNRNASDEEEYFGECNLDSDEDDKYAHEDDGDDEAVMSKIRRFNRRLQKSN